jgi:hypothetical protein
MKCFFRLVLFYWVPAMLSVATAQEEVFSPEPSLFDFDESAPSLIKFRSEPEGATVVVDSKVVCKTPCSREMAEGQYELLVRASNYDSYSQRLIVNGKQTVSVRLSPLFGWLEVLTSPPGIAIAVDGKVLGKTPLRTGLTPGEHDVLISDERWLPSGERVTIEKGLVQRVEVKAIQRQGGLVVRAVDDKGNALDLPVRLDGRSIGETPLRKKLQVGQYSLSVGSFNQHVRIVDSVVEEVLVKLPKTRHKAVAARGKGKGNKVEIDQQEFSREMADNAGLMGSMADQGGMDGILGDTIVDHNIVDHNMLGGIGGALGVKGNQMGSDGLADRGNGLGAAGATPSTDIGGTGGLGRRASNSKIARIGGDAIILGALDKSLIDRVIKRNMNQIKYCYSRQLSVNPKLNGKIVVKFVISGDGSVSKANTHSSTMTGGGAVQSCMNNQFLNFQFPEPKGGGIVIAKYPFLFTPQ